MNVHSALQTGLEGIQRGQQGAVQAATDIANTTLEPEGASNGLGGVIEPMVDLQLYERSIEASVQVVKTADEALGTMLDTLA